MALEVVFSFDTTGSMSGIIDQVRRNLVEGIGELFKEVPDLKIGMIAHGDYCDARSTYVTRNIDLTSNLYDLVSFVRNTSRTGGGDWPECYELVLNEAREKFNWTINSRKVFVLIGDAIPHEPHYHLNTRRLDWREEAKALNKIGVDVYTIQCLGHPSAVSFYETCARLGGGLSLRMDQFTDIVTLMNGIIYQQVSPDHIAQYEERVIKQGRMNRSLDYSFGVLSGQPRDAKGRFTSYTHKSDTGSELIPVRAGRFQILDVHNDSVIKEFVQDHDLVFKTGRGFYEFTKRESISDKKEIVVRDKITGDMFTGEAARSLLGMTYGSSKVSPKHNDTYNIFVQSTSYNRKLIGGTKFLYETDGIE